MIDLRVQPAPVQLGSTWERFEALYRDARDDVYAYVATLLRDPAAAEDVTALAFERAYRRRATFDRRRGVERAWLFGIARNAALDELRRRRRIATLVAEPEDTGSSAVADGAEVALRRTAVRSALASLSGREREIVALKFHGGLSNGDIGRVLGISETAAGSLLYRTIDRDQASLKSLHRQVRYSRIQLTIDGSAPSPAHHHGAGGGGFTLGRAGHDAVHVLVVAAGVLLIALAVAIPVGLVAALVGWLWLRARRKAREAALDRA